MDELRLALIGTGFWGGFQVAAWNEVPGARVVAVCDANRKRAEETARRFRVPRAYEHAAEMLRSESIDFVDIAASPAAHEPLVSLAASHRLAAICQKPMALEYAACERMVEVCRRAGVQFLIHENFRWQTPMRRVRQILESGQIGRPIRAHIQFSHGQVELFDNQPSLYTDPHFAMFDMGPHLLDLARFFFGEPSSVYAREFRAHPRFAGEDIVSVMLGYDRFHCHCELSWRTTDYEVFIEGMLRTLTWRPKGEIAIESDTGVDKETIDPAAYSWSD
ncbi:MAG: Gfo/Idh/MocA family protein, partial [Bryobacteraceae bacterium]